MLLCCADRPAQDTRDLDPENDGDVVERDRQRGLLAATWSVLHRPRRRSDARHLRRSARWCAAAVLCRPGSVGHCLAQACKWCLGVAARKLPDAKARPSVAGKRRSTLDGRGLSWWPQRVHADHKSSRPAPSAAQPNSAVGKPHLPPQVGGRPTQTSRLVGWSRVAKGFPGAWLEAFDILLAGSRGLAMAAQHQPAQNRAAGWRALAGLAYICHRRPGLG